MSGRARSPERHHEQGYTFDGIDSRVVVPSSDSLNPGTADFSYAVCSSSGTPAAGTDYDLLRKGLASTVGGEYKVEVLNVNGVAKALCLVKDANKVQASVRSPFGNVPTHTITCTKTSSGVSIQVDRLTRTRTVAALVSVANSAPLTLGAKADLGGDWFLGEIFEARVS